MGIRASNTTELIFQDCFVPVEDRLGREGQGFRIAMNTLDAARPFVGAVSVGIACAMAGIISGVIMGSGLGYLLAVMLVTEAGNRLRSKAIPEAFRGLPITLIYIGVLALAIYGFTGHSVIL